MVADEPHVRRRGFFVHVETPELDQIDQDSSEGVTVRLRVARPRLERAVVSSRKPTHAVRTSALSTADFRLETATDTHRQGRMPR